MSGDLPQTRVVATPPKVAHYGASPLNGEYSDRSDVFFSPQRSWSTRGNLDVPITYCIGPMDEKTANFVAVMLSGYAKRVLESRYDDLFSTELGERAKRLDPATKYLIEGGLYAALAYGDGKFPDNQPWKKFVFEILKDAPSELSKRLINGVRDEAAGALMGAQGTPTTAALQSVLALEDEALAIMIRWGTEVSEADFTKLLALASGLSLPELQKLDRLNSAQRNAVLGVAAPARADG